MIRTRQNIDLEQFACSRGMFCKSQCNQQQEQVGEYFSGTSRINSLSGFIGLHWTARPIERSSVKSNTPSSLPSSNAVSRLQLQSPGHRNQPPTSNIKELRIMQVVYLQERANKSAYHQQSSINCEGIPSHTYICSQTHTHTHTHTHVYIYIHLLFSTWPLCDTVQSSPPVLFTKIRYYVSVNLNPVFRSNNIPSLLLATILYKCLSFMHAWG
jgi:hypothetical protein